MRTCYLIPVAKRQALVSTLRRRVDILLRAKWRTAYLRHGWPGYGEAAHRWACEHGAMVSGDTATDRDAVKAFYGWTVDLTAWHLTKEVRNGIKWGRYWWARNVGPTVAGSALWAKRRQATGQRLRPSQVRVCRPVGYLPRKPEPLPVWAKPDWSYLPYRRRCAGDDW